jgi:anthranilate/para-aminobenzoate synthase component I
MPRLSLTDLDRRPSFALLGPGFGDGDALLLEDLAPVDDPDRAAPQLIQDDGSRAGHHTTRGAGPHPRLAALGTPSPKLGGGGRGVRADCAGSTSLPRPLHRPVLVYAPFEAAGAAPRVLAPGAWSVVDIDLDVPLQPMTVELDDVGYLAGVERIRSAIAAGDVYQVCYTLRATLSAPGALSGAELLARLARRGLPRFAAWVRLLDGTELVSGSPELFFEVDGRWIHTQPMKGTAHPDAGDYLVHSAKERAELAMITDLERNDLTPLCTPRSVRVTAARRVIELPYALQMVSDVEGELAEGVGVLDALAALHPGGSVTGAPKLAALAMIRELEATPRGSYCGALGLWQGPRAVFNLLIRTASRTPAGWTYGVGSGVVYDSQPDRELDELRLKLGALG